ncbi:hypothetical protein A6R68_01510, partial [Neotoma lepida]
MSTVLEEPMDFDQLGTRLQHLRDPVLEMPVKSSKKMTQCLGHLLLTLPLTNVDWVSRTFSIFQIDSGATSNFSKQWTIWIMGAGKNSWKHMMQNHTILPAPKPPPPLNIITSWKSPVSI